MSGKRINHPISRRKYAAFLQQCECYPGPDYFAISFDRGAYENRLRHRKSGDAAPPLALHIHDALPWRRMPSAANDEQARYCEYLQREFDLIVAFLPLDTVLNWLYCQINTFALDQIMRSIDRHFRLRSQGQYTVTSGLQNLSEERIASLSAMGFNHLNLEAHGAACVCPKDAPDLTHSVRAARRAGFKTVTITSAWPQQLATIVRDLTQLIDAKAEQVILRPGNQPFLQSKLTETWDVVLALFEAGGYVYLGLNHFVLRGDDLAVARRRGRLNYDLHGYFSGVNRDSIGLGLAATSQMGDIVVQNQNKITDYSAALDREHLPIYSGMQLSADDLLRRDVMHALICHRELSFEAIDVAHLIDFRQYFASELERLETLARDGLVDVNQEWITVTARGALYLPAICQIFNAYRRCST